MKSTTLLHNSKISLFAGRPTFAPRLLIRRFSANSAPLSELEAAIREDLTSRPVNEILEYLTSTNSHLLNIALADFLPSSCYPAGFSKANLQTPRQGRQKSIEIYGETSLPLGHHLVHFPPQVLSSNLLHDGTDTLHFPGPPFVRRLWTGGSLSFNRNTQFALHTNNMCAMCKEEVTDVWTKGPEGNEKVFVTIRRRIGGFSHAYESPRWSGRPEPEWGSIDGNLNQWGLKSKIGKLALVETRNLVFMKKKSKSHARRDSQLLVPSAMKRLMPANIPDFSVSLKPTRDLLFRFSALTFNAHRIHLEREYCQKVEGYRDLLVHGPLSLVLMLSVVRSQLKAGEMLVEFEYKNLVPLYAEEEMRICVRRDPEKAKRLEVWIEEPGGGYAVKGTALIDKDYALGMKSVDLTPDRQEHQESSETGWEPNKEERTEGESPLQIRKKFSN